MKTVVLDSQSLFDIAIQELGDITGMFDLAEQADIGVTDDLVTGQVLGILQQAANRPIRDYYASCRITPATAISDISGGADLLLDGVEFWGIEYDFVVSRENGTVS